MDSTGKHVTFGSATIFSGISRPSSPSGSLSDTISEGPSSNASVRPSNMNPSSNPLSPSTATMSLKSNPDSTPMTNKGSTSAASQPETPELPKGSGVNEDKEDDGCDLSEEDLARASEIKMFLRLDMLQMSQAIHRAKVLIPRDIALQRATIRKIQHFFAKSDTDNVTKGRYYLSFSRSEVLRSITEKVRKVYLDYSETRDNVTGMPSKAEVLAIRFCNPHETAPIAEELGGYLQAMNRTDLAQVNGVEMREQTLLDALASHSSGVDDMKDAVDGIKVAVEDMTKRIRALEKSVRPQELEHLTKKSDIMATAIQDFRVSVKGALDRRLTRVDLNKVTSKVEKDLVDVFREVKSSSAARSQHSFHIDATLANHAKDLNDLAVKHAHDLIDLENRLQDSFRAQTLAIIRAINGRPPKRPFTNASDTSNRLGSTVPMFDANDLFLDADFLDSAYPGVGNPPKKRRLDDTAGKMDFSDIV